jgi:hypothetical protein
LSKSFLIKSETIFFSFILSIVAEAETIDLFSILLLNKFKFQLLDSKEQISDNFSIKIKNSILFKLENE